MSHVMTNSKSRRRPPAEYWLYFVPIFLAALPAGLVQWAIALAHSGTNPSPVRRAMSAAHCVTPEIFSA
jgi:PufQ cytochrome subunit